MVERELTLGPTLDAAERARPAALLGHDGDRRDARRELAARIRDGSLDDRRDDVRRRRPRDRAGEAPGREPGYLRPTRRVGSDAMRFATWNVNSLKARLPRVEEWLGYAEPDVLCLQETKLADESFPR